MNEIVGLLVSILISIVAANVILLIAFGLAYFLENLSDKLDNHESKN